MKQEQKLALATACFGGYGAISLYILGNLLV